MRSLSQALSASSLRRWSSTAKRRIPTVLVVLVGMLLPAVVFAPPAPAATTYLRPFSVTTSKYFSELNRCVRVTLSGTMSFQIGFYAKNVAIYKNRKVRYPKVVVRSYANSCSGYTAKKLSKVKVQQVWNDKVCKGNVSVSIGYPWGVSATPTYSCGKVTAARRSSSYGSGSVYSQANSSAIVSFQNHTKGPIAYTTPYGKTSPKNWSSNCYSARVNLTLYVGNKSDSWSPGFTPCKRP